MIVSFDSRSAEDIYHGISSREARKIPQNIWKIACRKLDMLEAAASLSDLRSPPSNRLEVLKGKLKDCYSIRVNDQYRVIFQFRDGNAYDIDIVDYH